MSESMALLVDMLSEALLKAQTRLLALQTLLVEKGIVTDDELAARMRTIDDEATLEVELGPEHEEYRRLRQQMRDAASSTEKPQEDASDSPASGADPVTVAIKVLDAALSPRIRGWRQQYDRMKRARARTQAAAQVSEQMVDDYYAFFVWCYHLKDWLKHDELVPPPVQATVEPFVSERRPLEISGDIANGVKHLMRDQGKARVDPAAKVSAVPPAFQPSGFSGVGFQTTERIVVVVEGKYEAASDVADGCVAAWDEFLRIHGLLTEGQA